MGGIAIVTDSSAGIPEHLRLRHAIRIVPQAVVAGEDIITDGSMSCEELFASLRASGSRLRTASPSPGAFLEAIRAACAEGAESVVCLTLSAGYSATCAAARAGAADARSEMPGLDVRVVDTGGLAMAHGFAVLAAARALEAGAGLDCAVDCAARVGARARLIGAMESLDFAVRGGRVPRIVGWAASALHIKPVLAFENGRTRTIARTRTMERAAALMAERLEDAIETGDRAHVAVMHAASGAAAESLAALVRERAFPAELLITESNLAMAAHTGPGFLGLAYYADDG